MIYHVTVVIYLNNLFWATKKLLFTNKKIKTKIFRI